MITHCVSYETENDVVSASKGQVMKKQKSPCIDVCDFSGPKGWCLGCGRTRQECQNWKSMKPYVVNILTKDLRKRMAQMNNGDSNH